MIVFMIGYIAMGLVVALLAMRKITEHDYNSDDWGAEATFVILILAAIMPLTLLWLVFTYLGTLFQKICGRY